MASRNQPCGDGAQPILPPVSEPSAASVHRTMTITLTDAEMVALDEVMRVTDLSQRAVFRQAIAGLQVKVREAVHGPIRDDRLPTYPASPSEDER